MRFLGSKKAFPTFPTEMVLALFLSLFMATAWPQQTSVPSLHHRSNAEAGAERGSGDSAAESSAQQSTLPEDVSGAYDFDHINESIEIDILHNKLSGYISRLGDSETDSSTPLAFFFDQSSIDGSEILFQTRVVHGIWYSFQGTILRGNAKIRDDEGYYVLHGVLATHHPQGGYDKAANETIERRTVNFKSMQQ